MRPLDFQSKSLLLVRVIVNNLYAGDILWTQKWSVVITDLHLGYYHLPSLTFISEPPRNRRVSKFKIKLFI